MRHLKITLGLVALTATVAASFSSPARSLGSLLNLWAQNKKHAYSTNAGNVGIGTTTPAAKLDVNGSIAVAGQETLDSSGRYVGGDVLAFNPQQVALKRWYEMRPEPATVSMGSPLCAVFDGNHLWVARNNFKLVKVRASDGAELDSLDVTNRYDDLVFDGSNLWCVAGSAGRTTQFRARDGQLLGHHVTTSFPRKALFDGEGIWIGHDVGELWKLNPGDGAELARTNLGTNFVDMTFDGEFLWAATIDSMITKLDPADGTELDQFPTTSPLAALAIDGGFLWASLTDSTLVKICRTSGTVLDVVNVIDNVFDLSFDGEHLWLGSNSDGVQVVRVSDGQVVDQSTTTVQDLAFDGANVWGVGDDLHKF